MTKRAAALQTAAELARRYIADHRMDPAPTPPGWPAIHGITEANGVEWTRKVYLRSRQEMAPQITVYRVGGAA